MLLQNVNLSILMVVWVIQIPNSTLLFTKREKQMKGEMVCVLAGAGRQPCSMVMCALKNEIKVKNRSI